MVEFSYEANPQISSSIGFKLPIPKILAVMDGPFTNLVPIKHSNTFTSPHQESIHQRYVPKNGCQTKLLIHEQEKLWKSENGSPFLSAEIRVSLCIRAVNAYREFDDARPSDITNHGFGCWSILGGKIVNVYIAMNSLKRFF